MGKVLAAIQDMIKGELAGKGLGFIVEIQPGLGLYYLGDEIRLSQILVNIISNAIKFTPEGGSITLRLKEAVRRGRVSTLRFSVSDTGIGMTAEQIGRLFTSFEQADGTIARRFGGTGLGLAIAKSIVEKMDGRIWAESEYGVGSTFTFEANLEVPPEEPKSEFPALDSETADFSGQVILLVEDIELNREIFTTLLAETGVTVDCAGNGLEAWLKFEENPERYGLIVTDVKMPVMDGLEATRKIRASGLPRAKDVPIVALTADVFTDEIYECLKAGMNDHLSKPINQGRLVEMLKKYLGQPPGVNIAGRPFFKRPS